MQREVAKNVLVHELHDPEYTASGFVQVTITNSTVEGNSMCGIAVSDHAQDTIEGLRVEQSGSVLRTFPSAMSSRNDLERA